MTLRYEAVCIVGPTASGKSTLADRVASELGSEVVSVDAMQVYRGMDIGTAKTHPDELRAPIRMVDIASIAEPYSVALFQRDARRCVDEIVSRGRPAVLCGGTGLYLDAVIDEMELPSGEVGSEVRRRYEDLSRREGPEALHGLLKERDPRSADLIEPNNVRRVVRALELLEAGVSYADRNEHLRRRAPHYASRIWAITMDRERLHRRIGERVDEMFEAGLVDEVARLMDEGLVRESTAGQAIGYKEVIAALSGECTIEEARELIKTRTRRYAKRQLSWIRRDGRCTWLDYDTLTEPDAARIIVDECRREG